MRRGILCRRNEGPAPQHQATRKRAVSTGLKRVSYRLPPQRASTVCGRTTHTATGEPTIWEAISHPLYPKTAFLLRPQAISFRGPCQGDLSPSDKTEDFGYQIYQKKPSSGWKAAFLAKAGRFFQIIGQRMPGFQPFPHSCCGFLFYLPPLGLSFFDSLRCQNAFLWAFSPFSLFPQTPNRAVFNICGKPC